MTAVKDRAADVFAHLARLAVTAPVHHRDTSHDEWPRWYKPEPVQLGRRRWAWEVIDERDSKVHASGHSRSLDRAQVAADKALCRVIEDRLEQAREDRRLLEPIAWEMHQAREKVLSDPAE